MANSTKREPGTTILEILCEGSINMVRQSTCGSLLYVAASVVNAALAFLTLLGNILFMVALHKESSLHSPTKLLFRSLALTDLGVALLVQPSLVSFSTAVVMEDRVLCLNMARLTFHTATTIPKLSLLTLALLSVDGYLALTLVVRYRGVVTVKRARIVVFLAWLFIIAYRVTSYILGDPFPGAVDLVCIIITTFCHTKVLFALRQHRRQVQGLVHCQQKQVNANVSSNVRQLSKTMSVVFWVQFSIIFFSAPLIISLKVTGFNTIPSAIIVFPALSLRLVNSTLNPVIYCSRMKQVKQAVKETIRQFLCLSN